MHALVIIAGVDLLQCGCCSNIIVHSKRSCRCSGRTGNAGVQSCDGSAGSSLNSSETSSHCHRGIHCYVVVV